MGQNLADYFGRFAPAPQRAWTFVQDFTDMCAFLQTLPPASHVFFYCDRWNGNYEPRRFLVPDALIEDRSSEFGTFSFGANQAARQPTFVLMGTYRGRLGELQRLYPHCRIQLGPPSAENGQPAFIAAWPDAHQAPPERLVTPVLPMSPRP